MSEIRHRTTLEPSRSQQNLRLRFVINLQYKAYKYRYFELIASTPPDLKKADIKRGVALTTPHTFYCL